jgi:hypothetical protein
LYTSARVALVGLAGSSAGLLVACSSSGSDDRPTTSARISAGSTATTSGAGSASAPGGGSASAPSTSAPGRLSKAEFVARANALCRTTYPKVHPGPAPTGPTDYAALLAYAQATVREFPPYNKAIRALVAKSPDQAELTSKWVAVDEAGVAAGKPHLQELITAVRARDDAKIRQALDALNALPDESAAEGKFLTDYGLTECARLATT